MEAAARILAERGYEGLTTNHVAERAGVSVGSLYQYFPGKEAILAAVFERYLERMYDAARMPLAERHRSLADAIENAVESLLAVRAKDPKLHRRLMEEGPRLGRLRRIRQIQHKSRLAMRELLERHADELATDDLDTAAWVSAHLIESLTHALLALPRERIVAETVAAVLGYLRLPRRAKGRARA